LELVRDTTVSTFVAGLTGGRHGKAINRSRSIGEAFFHLDPMGGV